MTIDILNKLKTETTQLAAVQKAKKESRNKIENENREIEEKRSSNMLEKEILTKACGEARKMSADLFSSVSTNGLQTILGENLSVKIVAGEKAGVPTLDFKIAADYEDGYKTEVDPSEEDGGGVADVVSMTNLVTMNVLNADKNSAPLFLDEPTKFVSLGNADDVGTFLSEVAHSFDKQIIMVTHAKDTAQHADKTISVKLNNNGVSEAVEDRGC